jgi:hypothetical protein
MRYRLGEVKATGPQRFYALRLVRPVLEFLLSTSTSSSQVSSNANIRQ